MYNAGLLNFIFNGTFGACEYDPDVSGHFGTLILLFDAPFPTNFLMVYLAMGSVWALSMGFGSLVAAIGQWSDSFARFVPLALRPMFWISGVFYTASELPLQAQKIIWWNPLFHSTEALREGFFLGYASPISFLLYPYLIAILFYLLSLPVTHFVERTCRARHSI